jgi:membrane associated rhomboid family serine protease
MPEQTESDVATRCYRHPDRPTGLRCSNCDRPICAECMTPTPVGQRCPECVGRQQVRRPRSMSRVTPIVTYALIAINVAVYLLWERGGVTQVPLANYIDGAILGPAIADGEWYRLVTGAFLHASLLHIGFNMYALYVIGPILETRLGALRYTGLYAVGALWGSAGALLQQPDVPTVGASGAIFGLMAALFVVEQRHGVPVMSGVGLFIVINLVITFSVPGISIGGHLGGLAGGAAAGLLYEHTARRGGGPLAIAGTAALLLVAVAATIVAVR